MEGTELIAFNIIAAVGTARSNYIAAIDAAAEGNRLLLHSHRAGGTGRSAYDRLQQKMRYGLQHKGSGDPSQRGDPYDGHVHCGSGLYREGFPQHVPLDQSPQAAACGSVHLHTGTGQPPVSAVCRPDPDRGSRRLGLPACSGAARQTEPACLLFSLPCTADPAVSPGLAGRHL